MHLPTQAAPVARGHRTSTYSTEGILPQGSGTCTCSGDKTYNKCSLDNDECTAGFYPVCNCGDYNSSCSCEPIP